MLDSLSRKSNYAHVFHVSLYMYNDWGMKRLGTVADDGIAGVSIKQKRKLFLDSPRHADDGLNSNERMSLNERIVAVANFDRARARLRFTCGF